MNAIEMNREFNPNPHRFFCTGDTTENRADKHTSLSISSEVTSNQESNNSPNDSEKIIGSCRALQEAMKLARKVATTDATVLILGETGTGKELIAQAIHRQSQRGRRAMIKLNCAAIPHGLLESELFGHERGAFTGAVARRIGRFEAADRGTLFLDEIGDIPLDLQAKLLRVLQEGEFERLGSAQVQRADVRLIAATHRNLNAMVAQGEFRADLYYRLNVFPIVVPPLRERREDIALLVMHFVRTFAREMNKVIDNVPEEAMRVLAEHSWPGNIRELRNFIERSIILSSGTTLCPPLDLLRPKRNPVSTSPVTLEDAEREHICKALERTNWVVGGPDGAAAQLGIKRSTLYFRMRKLGISRPDKINPAATRFS
jgi:formate hydrogenlyase transcriptional activator